MKLDLDFGPSQEQLAALNARLREALQRCGVHAERIGRAQLIVEELACNAFTHGENAAAMRLRLHLQEERLVLELRDEGRTFDPRQAPRPALDAGIAERPVGGLGLYLVGQLADHIAYHRDGAYNVVRVTLLKPFAPAAESQP